MSRNWHAELHEPSGAIHLGGLNSSTGGRRVTMINPTCKRWHEHSYVLQFGAYGWTQLHVYADSLEDALEECAEWLADHAPGLIVKSDSAEYNELMAEACAERNLPWPIPENAGPGFAYEPYHDAEDAAMTDHTRTEYGWIPSWEWGIALEDPTTEQLYAHITGG